MLLPLNLTVISFKLMYIDNITLIPARIHIYPSTYTWASYPLIEFHQAARLWMKSLDTQLLISEGQDALHVGLNVLHVCT